MIVYWVMFAVPALLALFEDRQDHERFRPIWLLIAAILAVLIGFRWETGGDWDNYSDMVEATLLAPPKFGILSDPGFTLVLRLAASSRFGILLVTVVSGVMMAFSLTLFCLKQPRPWLAMAVAIPYLVIVMGMGYIRQGMAISCWLMGIMSIRDRNVVRYSAWLLLGSMFHSTALVLLPLGFIAYTRNLFFRIGLAVMTLGLLYYGLASARAENLLANYVQAEMSSSGTAIRLVITAIPSIIFLAYRDRFDINPTAKGVWATMSGGAIFFLLAFFVSPSSTAIDRLALYLLPIQVFVYSQVPDVFGKNNANRRLIVVLILVAYCAAFFVWLNFAVNSWAWLPYRFYFFEDGICLEC